MRSGIELRAETEGAGEPVERHKYCQIRLKLWLNRGDPVRWQQSIAPHLAYGDRGVPGMIPARALLTAEIAILKEGLPA